MSDLISRQAAIDALRDAENHAFNSFYKGLAKAHKIITDLPSTIDAVPVVRCKECIHRFVDGDNVRFNVCMLNHNKVQPDDWFCADGERKDGADNGEP